MTVVTLVSPLVSVSMSFETLSKAYVMIKNYFKRIIGLHNIFYEVYIAPKVGTTVALLHRQFRDACALQREVIRRRMTPLATRCRCSKKDGVGQRAYSRGTFSNVFRNVECFTHFRTTYA